MMTTIQCFERDASGEVRDRVYVIGEGVPGRDHDELLRLLAIEFAAWYDRQTWWRALPAANQPEVRSIAQYAFIAGRLDGDKVG